MMMEGDLESLMVVKSRKPGRLASEIFYVSSNPVRGAEKGFIASKK